MPPLRTMSSIKPMKTERTHEENQERAYIAASRRSDRSLEARVESARRASEIHKRRTGRSLRVTEQDVVNEEMYEEEDDDLPMQYRRLTAHLQTQNTVFNQRINAYLTSQVAVRRAMGNAAADQWQMNNNQSNYHFMNNQQFMNPSMMQMQQTGYQNNSMLPPQAFNGPMNYRQTPYPMMQNNMQAMRQNAHHRSSSVATPQELSHYQPQQSTSAQTSPVDAVKLEDRRMSLPAQNAMVHTPQSQQSPASRNSSSSNVATPRGYAKQSQSPQQASTPPQYQQQQQYRPQSQQQEQQNMTSPFGASFDQAMNNGYNPFTGTLPMNSQQMLYDAQSHPDLNMPQMFSPIGMQTQQRSYSYNPNGKPKNNAASSQQQPFNGLQQTLTMPPLDTANFGAFTHNGFMISPDSAGTDNTMFPSAGVPDLSFENNFNLENNFGHYQDDLKTPISGNVTPQDEFSDLMKQYIDDGNVVA